MNNYNLTSADRLTHIKIVVLSLIAATIVVCVGIAARATAPDTSTRLESHRAMLKASKPAIWSHADKIAAR
jgi:hypothetical protein